MMTLVQESFQVTFPNRAIKGHTRHETRKGVDDTSLFIRPIEAETKLP